jgi:iron(III) transport system substrate-binding protein
MVLVLGATGCWRHNGPEVVVYTALDQEFSQPILEEFQRSSGVHVLPKYDVESTKTVGLVNAIIAEKDRPRADVFWNNEILNTLRLQSRGLLDVYVSPAAARFPPMFRSPEGAWCGFAARARVLMVNTKLVPEADRPTSIHDLANAKWRGKVGMAKPLFGTTATHAACLFAVLGDDEARKLFERFKANGMQILSGNKQVALSVAAGQLAFGLTDTDDALIEVEHGHPVAIVYPDQQDDQLGTLFIPNTVAVIKNGPHPAEARKLVDYLLGPAVEAQLAAGPSAQIPLNPDVQVKPLRVRTPAMIHAMPVDFQKAAEKWDTAAAFLRDEFARGD